MEYDVLSKKKLGVPNFSNFKRKCKAFEIDTFL